MVVLAKNPNPIFTDVDGNPLENGYIFIGESGLDAESYPQDVYWDSDFSTAATSIRTKGGMPLNGAVTGKLFTKDKYSITVKDKRGEVVFTDLNATDPNDAWELTAGMPAFDEYPETTISGDDWYTVAVSAEETQGIRGELSVQAANNDIMALKFNIRTSAGIRTHENTALEIEDFSAFSKVTGCDVLGFRLVFVDGDASAGLKLQVLNNGATTFKTSLRQFGTGAGFTLVAPTTTDNDKAPDGSTASFLVAGEEWYQGGTGGTRTIQDVTAYSTSTSSTSGTLRMVFTFQEKVMPDISDADLVFDGSLVLRSPGSTTDQYSFTSSSETIDSVERLDDYHVFIQISPSVAIGALGPLSVVSANNSGGSIKLELS